MNTTLKAALAASAIVASTHAAAQITLYEGEGFRGRAFTADGTVDNLQRQGFNDRASSVVVDHGRWEVCEDARFGGHCVTLRKGSYDSLRGLGLDNKISSVRRVGDRVSYPNEAPAPLPAPTYDYRIRPNERIYQAQVVSVHAVMGPPEQRCWVEREQVSQSSQPNVGGAVLGAIIGGVLGHQVGNGRGNDVATAGGAIAGGVIGSNVNRQPGGTYGRDVQRCATTEGSATPAYWDVTYNFRGVEHRMQTGAPPGATVAVNERGEPRG